MKVPIDRKRVPARRAAFVLLVLLLLLSALVAWPATGSASGNPGWMKGDPPWVSDGVTAPVRPAFGPGTQAICGRFADVDAAHPACGAILKLAGRGVIAGYPDGTFRPNLPVTRAEFAKMAVLAFERSPQAYGFLPFSDVEGHWAARDGYLQAAVAMKAVNGFPDGTFRPESAITRAQAVKVAAATLNLVPTGMPSYTDVTAGDWFSGWVAVAQRAALIGSGAFPVWTTITFDGNRPATRAEAAMLLANLPPMPAEARQLIATRAGEAITALRTQDMAALALLVHPTKGLRFSPYSFVRAGAGGDLVFPASWLPVAVTDGTTFTWGTADGSGEPLQLTFSQYYARFIYDQDFAYAADVTYNTVWQRGNTINNVLEAYPGGTWVEYHFPGFDPQYGGMDWRSLRLVFEQQGSTWYLVGMIHDQWTI